MDPQKRDESAESRLQAALDMFGVGESIMRQNLYRSFPAASEAEIERRLFLWLSERPGAEAGDAPGRRRELHHG